MLKVLQIDGMADDYVWVRSDKAILEFRHIKPGESLKPLFELDLKQYDVLILDPWIVESTDTKTVKEVTNSPWGQPWMQAAKVAGVRAEQLRPVIALAMKYRMLKGDRNGRIYFFGGFADPAAFEKLLKQSVGGLLASHINALEGMCQDFMAHGK